MIQVPIRARGFFAVTVLGLTGELHIQFAVIGTAPAVAPVFHAPLVSDVGFGEPPRLSRLIESKAAEIRLTLKPKPHFGFEGDSFLKHG